jgi:hypothetical protein
MTDVGIQVILCDDYEGWREILEDLAIQLDVTYLSGG